MIATGDSHKKPDLCLSSETKRTSKLLSHFKIIQTALKDEPSEYFEKNK